MDAHCDDFKTSREKLNYLFYIQPGKFVCYKDFHPKNLKMH